MTTYNTRNKVGSPAAKDLFDNSENFDKAINDRESEIWVDRLGVERVSLFGAEKKNERLVEKFKVDMNTAIITAGYITVDSFQRGADLPNNELTQRNHILRDETTGEYYRWDGDLPKQVPAGSTPQSTGGIGKGAWISVGDASLRGELLTNNGNDVVYSISKTKYQRVGNFKQGYTLTKGNQCLKYGDFYYAYRTEGDLPLKVPHNSIPDTHWVCVGDANMVFESHTIFNFGGKDDNGTTDNRVAIQLAIEYMEFSGSRLLANSSRDEKFFGVSSFHPDYQDVALVIRSIRNLNIDGGRKRNASIRWTGIRMGEALFSVEAEEHDWGARIDNLGANAGNKLNYVFKASRVQMAIASFQGGCYEEAVLDGIHIAGYMISFNNVLSNHNGRDGFAFGGADNSGGWNSDATTSITMSSCWARSNKRRGYSFNNELWYSNLSSTGCDGVEGVRTEIAYYFASAKGVNLTGIGAEECKKVLVASAFSMNVNGIQISGIHDDPVDGVISKLDSFIEVSGNSITLSNLALLPGYSSEHFDNDVVVNAGANTKIDFDSTFVRSRVKVNKPSGIDFYRYPDIIYFPAGEYNDNGFNRSGNVLYPSSSAYIKPSYASISGTILKRTIRYRTESEVYQGLIQITPIGDAIISLDVSCFGDSEQAGFTQKVTMFKSLSGWAVSIKGDSQNLFSADIDQVSNLVTIQSKVSTKLFFLVDMTFSSDDSTCNFLL
ncbi:hypothetical protein [Moellerella wisconsensis]|uniref:tail fiber/spike domain-containing protein n=1 Tax=Moellerella wisconsensis TaxID=158849 RepID=UPI00307660D8